MKKAIALILLLGCSLAGIKEDFFHTGLSAKALALGGTAFGFGVDSIYSNPAGLAVIPEEYYGYSYKNSFEGLIDTMTFEYMRDITDDNVLRRRDSYEYDYINQLIKMNVPGDRDIKYSYDELHNRTYMQHGFGNITYNYDEGGMNFLQSYTEDSGLTVKYNYDKQGNPVYKAYVNAYGMGLATENYAWNDRDELISITGRVTENYTQDYKHRRVIKDSDGNISKYVYLQNNQPVVVERSRNDTTESYTDVFIYEGTKRVARVRIDDTGNTKTEIFVNNYQGSPVVVLSSTGNIQYQKYLDPWGNMEMEIGVPSSDIEFQYTDKEYDEDVMFYNFWRRYYDPYAGRFVGRDRVHLEDNLTKFFSINPYSYTRNNPLKYIDPDGKDYILLNDSKGAKGFGHNAALVGNDKEGWKYYSKEGYAIDNDIRSFKTLKSYGESDLAKRYDRQVQVKTTSEQDKVMKGFGDENYDKPYSLNEKEVFDKKTGTKEVISQNCADLTADIGNAGNVDMEKPSFMGFTYPNQQFDLLQQQTISTTK